MTELARSDGRPVKRLCDDAVAMGDVDYTDGGTLLLANTELTEQGVRLVLAGVDEVVKAYRARPKV